jgi:hypothetical protein
MTVEDLEIWDLVPVRHSVLAKHSQLDLRHQHRGPFVVLTHHPPLFHCWRCSQRAKAAANPNRLLSGPVAAAPVAARLGSSTLHAFRLHAAAGVGSDDSQDPCTMSTDCPTIVCRSERFRRLDQNGTSIIEMEAVATGAANQGSGEFDRPTVVVANPIVMDSDIILTACRRACGEWSKRIRTMAHALTAGRVPGT